MGPLEGQLSTTPLPNLGGVLGACPRAAVLEGSRFQGPSLPGPPSCCTPRLGPVDLALGDTGECAGLQDRLAFGNPAPGGLCPGTSGGSWRASCARHGAHISFCISMIIPRTNAMWACGFQSWPTPPALDTQARPRGQFHSLSPRGRLPTPDLPRQAPPRCRVPVSQRAALFSLALLQPTALYLVTERSGASSTASSSRPSCLALRRSPLPSGVALYTKTIRVRTATCSSRQLLVSSDRDLGP